MSKWIGYAVTVNCGDPLGCYQGTIVEADGGTLTLTKAFRNGFPYPKSKVTLNAADIKELKIIEARAEGEPTSSTVAVSKGGAGAGPGAGCKKAARSTVCQSLQAHAAGDVQPRHTKHNAAAAGAVGGGGGGGARRRGDKCLAATDASDPALALDFDFETNLALFDKRALWEEMRLAAKPDLLRQTEAYRHDENVLGAPPPAAGIRVPQHARGAVDFVTDDGVAVPSLRASARQRAWQELERRGLLPSALVLLARAAADLALRLVGGGRRLERRNAHQAPFVAVLPGHGWRADCARLVARLLRSHSVRVVVLVAGAGDGGEEETVEGARAGTLPPPDLVVVAGGGEGAGESARRWAATVRCGRLEVEPVGAVGAEGEVERRACLVALLPGEEHAHCDRLYLANVAPPHDLGLHYAAPFRASALLALHPLSPVTS